MIPLTPLEVTSMTLCTCLGHGVDQNLHALLAGRSGLKPCDFPEADLDTYIGEVEGINTITLPDALSDYDCRNNRLAYLGLQQDGFHSAVSQAKNNYGDDRIGLFLGTSTSGVQQTEKAYTAISGDNHPLPEWFHYNETQGTFSVVEFTQQILGLKGVSQVIATACSSSAKTFATAWRHINSGFCDAAVVGGVDSLCLMILYGFNSLQLVSSNPCRPADAQRDGISIGEAAGFVLLERSDRTSNQLDNKRVSLIGFGESSDGFHMSSPHPQGRGAAMAMQQALQRSGCKPNDVDYINLHGTATPANDSSEDIAVTQHFPHTPCSSTKGWTGHTLGAAGIIESIFSILCIQNNFIPGSLNTRHLDPSLTSNIQLENIETEVECALSNSFGFGGNNCSLLFGAN